MRAGINRVIVTTECVRLRAGKGYRTVEKRRRQIERTFRWKDLRRTFATWLRRSGNDLPIIRDLLGHTTTRMTERYAHVNAAAKHAAVAALAGCIRVDLGAPVGVATGPATGPLTPASLN